jgi:hypothetical protein
MLTKPAAVRSASCGGDGTMTDAQADARRSTTRVLVVDDEPAVAEVLRRLTPVVMVTG